MRFSIFITLILVSIFQSCNSTKKEIEADDTTSTTTQLKNGIDKILDERMKKEGYEFGVVQYLEDSDCSYVIYNESSHARLDPFNFISKDFSEFKENGLKVYFKYKPLRMMNRCSEASPIELISVIKRKN
jgi:hypothetical protein